MTRSQAKWTYLGLVALVLGTASGCTTVEPVPIALSVDTIAASTLDRPYTTAITLSDPALPEGTASAFGPQVGRYFLTGDFVVYRHLKSLAAPVADPSLTAEVLGTAVPGQLAGVERLTYFLVNPDGIVTGVAAGQLAPDAARCIQVTLDLATICEDIDRLSRDLQLFDVSVRTEDGLPVSSWAGPSATAPQSPT